MQLFPFDHCEDLRIDAGVKRVGDRMEFTYTLSGETDDVVIPPSAQPERSDGLWQATCFEAFISLGKSSYAELNFAPSRQWAAYRFTNYRQGMGELDIPAPEIHFRDNRLTALVEINAEPAAALNLTAVIERRNGVRSYWSLAHPKGNRPDFHIRDCFVGSLP